MSARTKGFILQSRLAFVRERFGDAGVDQVLALLPESDRATLHGLILISGWYPLELALRLDDAISHAFGEESEQALRELGRRSADDNLTKFQGAFIHGKSPDAFLALAPAVYRMYYETGSREYHPRTPNSGELVTTGAEGVTAGDCLTVMGWYERALELTGAKGPRLTHPECVARGGKVCRYGVTWS